MLLPIYNIMINICSSETQEEGMRGAKEAQVRIWTGAQTEDRSGWLPRICLR